MINTQKVANHVSDKLKLIELASLANFIDTYLKQTIAFVAKCVTEQKEHLIYDKFSYIIGFNNILANPYLTKIINNKQMIKLILTVLQDKAVLNKDSMLLLNMIKPNIKQCSHQTISEYKKCIAKY